MWRITSEENNFHLKSKEGSIEPAMLYGSETWCLRENEMGILRRAERAMVRAMCGAKPVEKRNTAELMDMLGLREIIDGLAKANGVRCY